MLQRIKEEATQAIHGGGTGYTFYELENGADVWVWERPDGKVIKVVGYDIDVETNNEYGPLVTSKEPTYDVETNMTDVAKDMWRAGEHKDY